VEVEIKLLPMTVSAKARLPCGALDGDSEPITGAGLAVFIVNGSAPEVPPPGAGLETVTLAVPDAPSSVAGTCAVSWLALTKLVGRAVPFQLITELLMKLPPLIVSVNAPSPAVTAAGASSEIEGIGLAALIVKFSALEVPPPGAGVITVTLAELAAVISAAGTWAISCVGLM